ncbi:helix-turn-helix transcriptional regulator [Dermabacteraceae bacterium TAE3-ERU27]|nr:helix-turn-helix transcriptional regulator [Dermabacteraceae bacterium TAE3-ERU27]
MTDDAAWMKWIRSASGGANDNTIAKECGLSPSTITRWREHPPQVHALVKVAKTYGVSVAEGLIAAGYVSEDDLYVPKVVHDLTMFDDGELIAEIKRRLSSLDKLKSHARELEERLAKMNNA